MDGGRVFAQAGDGGRGARRAAATVGRAVRGWYAWGGKSLGGDFDGECAGRISFWKRSGHLGGGSGSEAIGGVSRAVRDSAGEVFGAAELDRAWALRWGVAGVGREF